MFQNSGRWPFGSHWPKSSRKERMRTFAPSALLVAAAPAERGLEAVLLDRVEQRDRLEPVARGARAGLVGHATVVDRFLHGGDDQSRPDVLHHLVAVVDDLGEVVAGVDVASPGTAGRPARTPCGRDGAAPRGPRRPRRAPTPRSSRRPLPRITWMALGLEGPEVRDLGAHSSSRRRRTRRCSRDGHGAWREPRAIRTRSSPARPNGLRGRRPAGCRGRIRSTRTPGRGGDGRGDRDRARSARRPCPSTRRVD